MGVLSLTYSWSIHGQQEEEQEEHKGKMKTQIRGH